MERVKDISKLKLLKGNVLLKLVEKPPSTIIVPDTIKDADQAGISHGIVAAMGSDVEDIEVGDIVMDFGPSQGFEWEGEKYAVCLRLAIVMAVTPDNFDPAKKAKKAKLSV